MSTPSIVAIALLLVAVVVTGLLVKARALGPLTRAGFALVSIAPVAASVLFGCALPVLGRHQDPAMTPPTPATLRLGVGGFSARLPHSTRSMRKDLSWTSENPRSWWLRGSSTACPPRTLTPEGERMSAQHSLADPQQPARCTTRRGRHTSRSSRRALRPERPQYGTANPAAPGTPTRPAGTAGSGSVAFAGRRRAGGRAAGWRTPARSAGRLVRHGTQPACPAGPAPAPGRALGLVICAKTGRSLRTALQGGGIDG